MRARILLPLLFVATPFGVACGDDTAPFDGGVSMDGAVFDGGVDAPMDGGPDSNVPTEGAEAHLYIDQDTDDRTRRFDGWEDGDMAVAGAEVRLLGSDMVATTDMDGFARFPEASGTFLVDTGSENATTHNAAPHLMAAAAEGAVKVTIFGDSLPVWGPEPRFGEVFASHLREVTDVTLANVAVSGSTSDGWEEEGGGLWHRVEAEIEGTDLFVVSLGGNDFVAYINNLFTTGGMNAVFDALGGGARMEAQRILERVLGIVASIRMRNPDADFAYILFPDYPTSANWRSLLASVLDAGVVPVAVDTIRTEFAAIIREVLDRLQDESIIVTDLYRLTKEESVDPLLLDEVHFTQYGHQRVGEELFLSVGGVVVGDPTLHQRVVVGRAP